MSTSVSIIIPVLNGEKDIRDLLIALINQAGISLNYEIIVVDNGSVDQTKNIVQEFDVTLLDESTPGPGPARNRGLYFASGDIIAHLDADTIPTRHWLTEIIIPFQDPTVMITAGKTLVYQPETPAQKFYAGYNLYDAQAVADREIVPFAPSLNMAVRRDTALHVGGWAEDMPTAEDVDFCHRVLQAFPSEIVYQPGAVLFHKIKPDMKSLRRTAWSYGEGMGHFVLKYRGENYFSFVDHLLVLKGLTYYSIAPYVQTFKRILRNYSLDEEQFAYCQRSWHLSFWRGFYSMYRTGQRKNL